MNKKKSFINPTTICMGICAILLFNVFYKTYEYSLNDPIGATEGRLVLGITGAIGGAFMGLILRYIGHLFFRPSRTDRLIRQQNKILSNNNYNPNSKVNELKELNELKKSGALSEEEFKKMKNEILNRN
ncbi:SHOCT domain-containing protein [Clostridium estertheticum]|uniref:SHOCT domain-containing protein n=1 Tax=Clostridium estertheticum TaxID=238834 RepID=UPI001CF185F9|nr:SHOCT domain-containing protein [Clostridium estertheticum]MCB2357106.1 SHOCT domain-containing protein [Clostridium estertheticum]WAG44028.1 SHOCT domain-containing protein [Clostridium estertheticum]